MRTDQAAASNSAAADHTTAASNSPDWWTTTKVQAKFFADSSVKGRNIDVDTHNGIVTLTGTVESQEARNRAEALARGVDGVSSVQDNLAVQPNGVSQPASGTSGAVATSGRTEARDRIEPAWITTKIQAQYFANPSIKPWNIDVTTMGDGTVTLNGTVENADAKSKAETIARNTDGVKTVDDRLRVKSANSAPAPNATAVHDINEPDAWLTAKVQSKYYTNDLVKARDINVDTKDGIVTLNGTVDSAAERDEADALARSTDGVKDVHDNLTVTVSPASAHLNPVARLPEANHVSTDDWITTKIRSRFFIDPHVKNMNIDVSTVNGVVTLTGQVADQQSRVAAEAIASRIDGVTHVENKLTVKQ